MDGYVHEVSIVDEEVHVSWLEIYTDPSEVEIVKVRLNTGNHVHLKQRRKRVVHKD
jgi:hypothetical protein